MQCLYEKCWQYQPGQMYGERTGKLPGCLKTQKTLAYMRKYQLSCPGAELREKETQNGAGCKPAPTTGCKPMLQGK